ncbi:MAG: terminase small subunit protein [Spirochaetes bacterium]|nr:terminase small subunit protein [Spirochaetota bacterium]
MAENGKHAGGRPTLYCEELTLKICERIVQGDSLRTICAADDMPSCASVFLWLSKYPKFSEQYAQAKASQMESMAEDILEIADDRSNDIHEDKDGNEKVDWEVVQRSRLKVDTRKWLMSKLAPKKWGEVKTLQHTGADGGSIKSEVIERGAQVAEWMDKLDPETRKKVLDAAESSDTDKG